MHYEVDSKKKKKKKPHKLMGGHKWVAQIGKLFGKLS